MRKLLSCGRLLTSTQAAAGVPATAHDAESSLSQALSQAGEFPALDS